MTAGVDGRPRETFSWSVKSIRTRYSLATASFLLIGLSLCFVCGRFALLHLLKDAELQIGRIGGDISSTVSHHAEDVQARLAEGLASVRPRVEEGRVLAELVKSPLTVRGESFLPTVVMRFSPGGDVLDCACAGSEPKAASASSAYLPVLRGWCGKLAENGSFRPIGILKMGERFHYVTLGRLRDGDFLLVGRAFVNNAFIADIRRLLPGMEIGWVDVPKTATYRPFISPSQEEGVPSRYGGSIVELRGRSGEAAFAMVDMIGETVAVISVSVPKTFAKVTFSAIGRFAMFVAIAGMLLVIPIFWLQGRLLLNPLTKMTKAVANLADRHADVDCPRLDWQGRDEFALLAASVNRMLETISARAVSVANLESRHQALINGLPDALAVFDVNGRLVSIIKEPEGGAPLPGFVRGELPDGAVFGFPEVDRLVTVIADTVGTGALGEARLKVQRPKGVPRSFPTRHFELRLTRMDGHFALAIIRDVSKEVAEHKLRLEAERRVLDSLKRESLTSLAAGIAHDMNNVLSIVLNAAESADADPSGDSVKALGIIREAVRRGTSMMRELRAFAGENRMEFVRANPKMLIDDMLQLVSRVVGPNIVLSCDVDSDVPDVDVDMNQFWKILFNIVKNASEAIGDNPGHIRVHVMPFQMTVTEASNFYSEHPLPAGPGAIFRVEDDGDGIRQDILSRLFDPYVSSKAMGRGLGLATVRTIVEAHLGGICVKSDFGGGTTFMVYIPASKLPKAVPPPASSPAPDKLPESETSSLSGDVLVVDNDEAILTTTTVLLKVLKLNVHVARDRREALAVVRRHAKHLRAILLDAHLGGFDTVRLLGAFRIGAPGVPVVVVSGSDEEELRKLFAVHPYDAFLAKPFTSGELKAILLKLQTSVA